MPREPLYDATARRGDHTQALNIRIEGVRGRLSRLVDAYTDGMIEKELFTEKKLALVMEQRELEDERKEIQSGQSHFERKLDEILDQLKSVCN